MSTSLYIGTAGWAYPHWNGVVFPKPHPATNHPLELLTQSFNVVAVNSSFYQPLKPEVVKLWIKKVQANPRFRFTAKLQQRFTHARIIEETEVEAFKAGLKPLQNCGKFWSAADAISLVVPLHRGEPRIPDPVAPDLQRIPVGRGDAAQQLAGGGSASARSSITASGSATSTSRIIPAPCLPTAFLRQASATSGCMDGIRRTRWAGSIRLRRGMRQHDYLYSEAELSEWTQRIERVSKFSDSTFVIFNNDAEAKSVVNALQLQEIITGIRAAAPYTLRRRFPVELENFGPRQAEQQYLFPAA